MTPCTNNRSSRRSENGRWPSHLVGDALAANDRFNYRLTLLHIDVAQRIMHFGARRVVEGEPLTLDATTGYAGLLASVRRPPVELMERLAKLAY